MRPRDARILVVAGGAWAAALLCSILPATAWWTAVICGLAGAVLLATTRWGVSALWALAAFSVCAVAVSAAMALPARASVAALDGHAVEVVAEVTSSASIGADGRLWFDAQTISAGPPNAPASVQAPVRVGVESGEGGWDLGAVIAVRGQGMATGDGERAAMVVFGVEGEIRSAATGIFAVAADVRADFIDRATRLPEPGAGLLPGLAVGDTRAVSNELNQAMLDSGLSHLTAVSGANCAIVVAAAFWAVALCGGGRWLRVVTAAVALCAFVVLVTPEPSVVRAGTMAGLGMLTLLLGRPAAGAGVLATAVVVILIGDPWLAATPGFALSAVSTGALILLAPALDRGLRWWMPAPLSLAIAVPLAAQLACGPIVALFAEQQSIVGVAANIIAAPAAPIATVVGLLACLSGAIAPLADLLAASAWLPAAWVATTASTTASLPGATVLATPGPFTAAVVALLSGAVGAVIAVRRGGAPLPRIPRRAAGGVLVVAVALAGASAALHGPLATLRSPQDWALAACDVGQGDALLVRSEGRIALIDTGADAELLSACLRGLAVEHVDLLVLTHFDADHVGAAAVVHGRVGTVLHGPISDASDAAVLADLERDGAIAVEAEAGQRGVLGGSTWRVLWPRRPSAALQPGNDTSVVLSFEGGGVPRSLFLGDLSASPQQMLLSSGAFHGPYDVVKVAHHGSADQEARLYEAVGAAVGLISVGEGNDYGHPRREALAMLGAARVLRTDESGRILLGVGEGGLQVWTERSGVDGHG